MRPEGDHTGVRLELTPEPQAFSAGMFTYASGFVVPPREPAYHVPATCCYAGWEQIKAFAFRVHAHSLGRCLLLGPRRTPIHLSPDVPKFVSVCRIVCILSLQESALRRHDCAEAQVSVSTQPTLAVSSPTQGFVYA